MRWVLSRLTEPSTWAGLAVLATVGEHVAANPTPQNIVATLAGAAAMFAKEGKPS